jgi:hypothetical protein
MNVKKECKKATFWTINSLKGGLTVIQLFILDFPSFLFSMT